MNIIRKKIKYAQTEKAFHQYRNNFSTNIWLSVMSITHEVDFIWNMVGEHVVNEYNANS